MGSKEKYLKSSKHRGLSIAAVVIVTICTVFITLAVGNIGEDLGEIFRALFTFDKSTTEGRFVWLIDLPMIVIALIVGAGLSLSGTVMQCILKNPLASPYTLGLSSAAAFGAAFAIIFLDSGNSALGSIAISNPYVTMACAFLFSMIATGAILLMTKLTNVSAETMVLSGIAIGAIFSAGLSLMQYFADSVQLSAMVSWSFGDLNHSDWQWDFIMLGILLPIAFYFFLKRWDLNSLDAGDDVAKGLGVNTERFRTLSLLITAFLSAMLVSRYGVIAFIGLIGPHIARMIVGSDHRYLIPMSMVLGGCILLIANCVAANIVRPMVLPVGLLTSLLGGPMFIYLLARRYRR
ncbi:FecCD family ABC transporter permease [Methanomethylophilus alvi]|uniref:FecCD family ABC transporter permease n=1 Tax=Methanomethylophilus alvi TaxID=1291540 RepID=UPI0037DC46A2